MKCLGIAPCKKTPCNFIESFRQCVMNFKQNKKQLQMERTRMLRIKRLPQPLRYGAFIAGIKLANKICIKEILEIWISLSLIT